MSPAKRSNVVLLADQLIKLIQLRPGEVPYEPVATDENDPNYGVTLHEVAVFEALRRLQAALETGDEEVAAMRSTLDDLATAIGLRREIPVDFDQVKPCQFSQKGPEGIQVQAWPVLREGITWPVLRKGITQPEAFVIPVLDADGNPAKSADGGIRLKPHPDARPADKTTVTYVKNAKAASGMYWICRKRPETESRLAGLETQKNLIAARLKQEQQTAQEIAAAEPPKPKTYLTSWAEILSALDRHNDDATRTKISRLNENFNGPIISPGQGAQPFAEKTALINWWNELETRFREKEQKRIDSRATVQDRCEHGRDGVVIPGIIGHEVKSRRKR
jgi:hypothetical protein